ncbi:MAG: NAD(+)/NADH kinase, partial [Desulfobulbaceae bacterium]|nr:NAD(+)/NADH kinase [Desulfobulbaceae bacterium]
MTDFTNIKKAGIILKKGFPDPGRVCADVLEWFAKRSVETVIDDVTPDMDLLVILGGDGTLLHVADRASEFGIPVLGVNLGDLGFLTEVSVDERNSAFESIMMGDAVIDDRMMLKARLCRGTQFSEYCYALNDVVISKGNLDHLVKLDT